MSGPVLVTCWGCQRDDSIGSRDVLLHLGVDQVTFTYSWMCRDCGYTNVRPISGPDLNQLLAVGVPVVPPQALSVMFKGQLADAELTAAYVDQWARQ